MIIHKNHFMQCHEQTIHLTNENWILCAVAEKAATNSHCIYGADCV